jgi:hypothetical protein
MPRWRLGAIKPSLYAKNLAREKQRKNNPRDRLDPRTVMVDFILFIAQKVAKVALTRQR